MATVRKVGVVTGTGSFVDLHHMKVRSEGGRKVIKFKQAIIAAGSEAVRLPFIPDDPRVVDSTGALEPRQIPECMTVIGGGIIGLEMAMVYATLGVQINVVEMLDGLMIGADRDLIKVWEKYNSKRFARVTLETRSRGAEARRYGLVLATVGSIDVYKQMRTDFPHISAIGDNVGQPMLAHKTAPEGQVAAEAARGGKSYFDVQQIPSVAYTNPEVAWMGKREDESKAAGIKYGEAVFP